ncbi:MAG TPA: D-amino-acid transaminase [Hyphomicrobiaceae bacterium]|nr:D-amino-acid transaminase [Hyphomicrobiaceae bacterium]
MSRFVYVNGRYVRYAEAQVHAEDRGFQFGDAVYEVCEIRDGSIIDETRHMQRLERSLGELSIDQPMSARAWHRVMRETARRNNVRDGIVYLQVSRGAGPRNFLFSGVQTAPTAVCIARAVSPKSLIDAGERGIAVITHPDIRWGRCDIKTVMLLPASLAKEKAKKTGAQEAWLTDADGMVTEGGSSNAWIITGDGELITRPTDQAILRGVTRTTLIDLIGREGLQLVERAFSVEEAKLAREAFVTSATNLVMPVVKIDDTLIGDGRPGPIATRLRAGFHTVAEARTIQ